MRLLHLLLLAINAPRVLQSGDYVVYSWTANDRLAQQVISYAQQYDALPGLPANAPGFGQPIRIYLAPNDAIFRQVTEGNAPEWGAGVAIPEAGVIALRAYGGNRGAYDELRRVLRHELAHVALHRYLGETRIPRWFDEGYAEWSAGEFDNDAAWLLRVAFATQRAPPLDSLELSWPAMSTDARIAYLLAASVVQYMVRESGTRGLTLFLQRWRDSRRFDTALANTYGLSVDQLEAHWKHDVKRRYGWLAALTQTSVAFTLLAFAVLALYVIRRRRDRAHLARLKANELPDQPAYWIPEETATETETGFDRGAESRDIEQHGETDNQNTNPT
jgi:hypothetical protein